MTFRYKGLVLAYLAAIAALASEAHAQQRRGDRFSIGTLSQAQVVNATRAGNGSSSRTKYLKATCEQELEAANRLPNQHFANCEALADYLAGAGVRSCPSEMRLAYLRGSGVGFDERRGREPGEQCLWRDGVWVMSLNCANFFASQPEIPLTPVPPAGPQGPMGPIGPQGLPGTDCTGQAPIDPPRVCPGEKGDKGDKGDRGEATPSKPGRCGSYAWKCVGGAALAIAGGTCLYFVIKDGACFENINNNFNDGTRPPGKNRRPPGLQLNVAPLLKFIRP